MAGKLPFSNDGSFMEMFQKMQAAQKAAEKPDESDATDADAQPPPPPPGSTQGTSKSQPRADSERSGGEWSTVSKQHPRSQLPARLPAVALGVLEPAPHLACIVRGSGSAAGWHAVQVPAATLRSSKPRRPTRRQQHLAATAPPQAAAAAPLPRARLRPARRRWC